MKFKTTVTKLRVLLFAASLAVVFVFCTCGFREPTNQASCGGPIEELVYRTAKYSAVGCSRIHSIDIEVSTSALTGFTPSQLRLMPRSFWRYDAGNLAISYQGISSPCEGMACELPKSKQETTFGTIAKASSRGTTNLAAVASCVSESSDANSFESTINNDLNYKSVAYDTMERPPNLIRI